MIPSDEPEVEEIRDEIAWFQGDFCDISNPCAKAIIGAKGVGKTWIGARFIAQMVYLMPGSKGLFACATNRQTADIWEQDIKTLLLALGWPFKHNESKQNVIFWNGTMLHMRSAESPGRIESIQYEWGWQDEVSLSSLSFCKTFSSRIRAINGTGHRRFTSMPDDPEHWIYTYLEDSCQDFHEVSLYDNPNKEFVRGYKKILEEIYSPAELTRYLSGERTNLTGLALFAVDKTNREEYEYDPKEDIYFVWDFNNEYRAVTAWQQNGYSLNVPRMNCIQSYQMKEAIVFEDAKALASLYEDHEGYIYLHGDASGDNRTAQATETMWQQIRKVFEARFPGLIRYIVPEGNPNVKDTIQVTNWALRKHLLSFSDPAVIAYRYLMNAKSDKNGEIDKTRDYQPDAPRTHEVDTIRYLAMHIYEDYFPGAKKKSADLSSIRNVYGEDDGTIW